MSFFSTLLSFLAAPRRRLHLPPHRLLSKTSDSGHSPLPPPPSLKLIGTPEDKSAARAWIAEFKKHGIPRSLVRFTFARSSGPGGQNVNKVNTKASLRCEVDAPWVPAWAKAELRRSLHTLLIAASSAPIKNDPTKEQQVKVKNLERTAKAIRRKEKGFRSHVKQGRRMKDWD
ncbi:hypothetical protein M378DRAFT_161696 [Amanita muscaria Koide BX008]|uniref:Uncharacterized protein n=1 Tax=Amanita muscaria (strain Koide BX008) TaxID=946122 RepID=A0A0C2WVB5_AMAMK|nr:hypothetical protein M378DRAFT_161696 [Amanita muscaria Koide BX008]